MSDLLLDTFQAYREASGREDELYLAYKLGRATDAAVYVAQQETRAALKAHLAAIKAVSS